MPVRRVIAFHELVKVFALERVGLEGEMLVGAEIVDPELLGPGGVSLAGFLSKKSTLAFTPCT